MTSIRGLRALLAVVAAFVLAPGAAHAASITSSTSGDWSDPATWVGGVVPDPGDSATIKQGHAVTLTGDVSISTLEVEGGGMLTATGWKVSSADVALHGDYYTTSWFSGGTLEVSANLLVENTAVSNATVTVLSGTTKFSGPLPGDDEASSFWQSSTFTQTAGDVILGGHAFTGDLDPVLDNTSLTVRGANDLNGRQLTLTNWGGVYFEPTALTGIGGAPMLSVGALTVSGVHQTTVDWSGIPGGAADLDRVNLIAATAGDATDLIYNSSGSTVFGGPLTGESLHATYSGNPRPAANPLPSVSASTSLPGHALVGDTITCDPGTWTPDGTKTYAWTSDGNVINGETASTFTATYFEQGTDVECTVAVTASGVTGTETSSDAVHVDVPPGNLTDPEVTSANADPTKASVGDVLTCDPGLWSATSPTYTYAWKRDGMLNVAVTTSTYTVGNADKGTDITCEVYATEGLASSPPVQSAGAVEISAGPAATTPPTATSTRTPSNRATSGDVLTCNPGVWSPDGTKTYAWKRDNTPIANATAATYAIVGADLGTDVTCTVTVTAGADSGSADSAAVTVVAAPTNSVAPSITGAVTTGKSTPGVQLTCTPGTWTGSPTYAYAWKRGTTEVATTSTYTPVGGDAGATLTCTVTATRDTIPGTPVTTSGVAIVNVPGNTVAPSITGTPVAGKTRVGLAVTCAPGTWTESPTFTYAWERDGTPINGATAATYTPVGADLSTELTCTVSATAGGIAGTPVTAAGVDVLATAANTVAPSITGALAAGQSLPGTALTCDPGTWTLSPTLDYAWKRGATTVATTSTYTPVAADASSTLTCEVTGTANGVPSAAVASTGVAILPIPEHTAAPTLSGSGVVGEALTCATGSWAGNPELFVRWLRGDTIVASGSTVYTIVRADRGAELRCKVTATTLGVERDATSAPVTAKAAAPIAIDERPDGTITTRSTRVAYTLAPDVTVTGCTLNGAALASCASPISLTGLASKADYAFVLNLRNEYGEDETRTVDFATSIGGPSVAITTSRSSVPSYTWLKYRFTADAGALVACTFDGAPVTCANGAAEFLAPRSGEHVFSVTATDAYGASSTDSRALTVKDKGPIVPKRVYVTAGATMTVPSTVDLREYRLEGLGAAAVGSDDATWGLRFKAPAKAYDAAEIEADQSDDDIESPRTNRYRVQVFPVGGTQKIAALVVDVVKSEAVVVDETVGGVIDPKSPLTCPKGSPGSTYLWYIDDKLVRTDASNVFPVKLLPRNGTVACAVNDPEKGLQPPVKTLIQDGIRVAAAVKANGTASFVVSNRVEMVLTFEQVNQRTVAVSTAAKPAKARYKTLKTVKKTLRRGWTRVSLGRKLPKSGYRITIKIKKGKRYGKPLVLSKG